ncbi:MAG: hypothetical protein V3S37_02415 [Dehalococcoidia bacterium]
MPKKSKRIASRQAQLSGRARRVRTHGPAGIPAAGTPSSAPEPRPQSWAQAEADPSSETDFHEPPAPETPRPTPAAASRSRGRFAQSKPTETYFVPELRRIGMTSVVIFAILAVLVFVLR